MRAVPLCAALVLCACVSACGTFAVEAGPSGIDGLTIPMATVDPAHFVRGVDNPWLALTPGSVRQYDGTGGATMTVTVLPGTVEIAGVATTAVRTDPAGTVDYLAQDAAGNVWRLGADAATTTVSWRAGESGAEAGLVIAASPRRGDGYRTAYVPGVVDEVATITDAPDGPSDAGPVVVETETVTDTYEKGAGLAVRVEGSTRWELRTP